MSLIRRPDRLGGELGRLQEFLRHDFGTAFSTWQEAVAFAIQMIRHLAKERDHWKQQHQQAAGFAADWRKAAEEHGIELGKLSLILDEKFSEYVRPGGRIVDQVIEALERLAGAPGWQKIAETHRGELLRLEKFLKEKFPGYTRTGDQIVDSAIAVIKSQQHRLDQVRATVA